MGQFQDIVGQKFNRLTVIKKLDKRDKAGSVIWLCRCDCGNEIEVSGSHLRRGHTKSCGCLRDDVRESKIKDLTGQKFGKLTVIERGPSREVSGCQRTQWLCECECGNRKYIVSNQLLSGRIKSCGCSNYDHLKTVDGLSTSKLYNIYMRIVASIENEKDKKYPSVGAKGIRMCEEWRKDFLKFHDWAVNNGYSDDLSVKDCTLVRIDKDKDFEPSNCKWSTMKEQQRSRTNNKLITYKGEVKSLAEWGEYLGMRSDTLGYRLRKGWTVEEAFETPLGEQRPNWVNPRREDITGQKFGKLTALEWLRSDKKAHTSIWLCECECGNTCEVSLNNLKTGHTTSCGCMKGRITHGKWGTRLYNIYYNMLQRCSNPNRLEYHNYGGRGISVCEEWKEDFTVFYDWAISSGYSDDLTIERINVNGDYTPENCKWATMKEQSNNTRRNVRLVYEGVSHTIAEWVEIYHINRSALERLLKKNSFEGALRKLGAIE